MDVIVTDGTSLIAFRRRLEDDGVIVWESSDAVTWERLQAGKVAAGHIHKCPVAPRAGSLGEGSRLENSRARELRMASHRPAAGRRCPDKGVARPDRSESGSAETAQV